MNKEFGDAVEKGLEVVFLSFDAYMKLIWWATVISLIMFPLGLIGLGFLLYWIFG